jgi:hypothetical protein
MIDVEQCNMTPGNHHLPGTYAASLPGVLCIGSNLPSPLGRDDYYQPGDNGLAYTINPESSLQFHHTKKYLQ